MSKPQEQEALKLLKTNAKPSKKTGSYITPTNCIIAVLAAAYGLSPIDFIPDFIPFIGLVDDVGIIAAIGTFIAIRGRK